MDNQTFIKVPWKQEIDNNGNIICVVTKNVSLSKWDINVTLPRGFRSDGMSVPRFFWRFISPKIHGKTVAPAIIHDFLYTSHAVSRKEADMWLRKALLVNKYSYIKSWLVYFGVCFFGKTHWK